MTLRSDRDPAFRVANDPSRLSAILIWVIAAAIICAAATWPRWHSTPPANVPLGSSASASTGGGTSTSAAGTGQASVAGVATAPPGAARSPNDAAGASGAASSGAVAAHSARIATITTTTVTATAPSHIGNVTVPASVEDWQHLNDKQHIALAPFVDEWAHLPDSQKRKWLAIAAAYQRMSADEQQRLHARMLRWVQMTPDERTIARENYQMSRVLPPGARQEAWRAYEALSPAQKAKLAAAERSKRRKLVVSAPPDGRAPLSSRDTTKNAAVSASPALSTETLVPLGVTNGSTAAGANASLPAHADASSSASQPAASSSSDTHGRSTMSGKGFIGNLNVGSDDRP